MHSSTYWKAIYEDGTSLCQYEEDGTENKYPDIDRSKLATFEIRKAAAGDKPDRLLFKMFLEPGRRLICRRRVMDKYKIGGNAGLKMRKYKQELVYLVGWQATIGGRSVQDIAYIFEDGHVELAGMWRNEAIYSEIKNPLPCETKCYDERHFSVDAVVVNREKKALSMDAVLVKKETEGKDSG